MNTHRTIGFVAAVLVTVGQIAVFATDTAAAAQNATARGEYQSTFDARVSPRAPVVYGESDAVLAG